MNWRFGIVLAGVCLAIVGHAGMQYPPKLENAGEIAAYTDKLMKEEPWILMGGRLNRQHIEGYVIAMAHGVAALRANPDYLKEAETRPRLRRFILRSIAMGKERKYVLRATFAKSLGAKEGTPSARDLLSAVEGVTEMPLNSVLTGILNSFPAKEKAEGFRTTNISEKLDLVRTALKQISEAELKSKFRGERFQLPEGWTKKDVAALLEQSVKRSYDLFELSLRLLADTGARDLKTLHFDDGDSLVSEVVNTAQEALGEKINAKALSQDFALWMEQHFEFQEVEVPKTQRQVLLRELGADVAYFRGSISGDCSTSASGLFSFSPRERNFLIERNGEVLGHTSGTMVTVEGESVYYLHDLKGMTMGQEDTDLVFFGILDHPEIFGAKYVVLLSPTLSGSIGWSQSSLLRVRSNNVVRLAHYPGDVKVRQLLHDQQPNGTGYDGVVSNSAGHLPIQDFNRRGFGPTEFIPVDGGKPSAEEAESSALQYLTLRIGGAEVPSYVDKSLKKKIEAAARVLANEKGAPLEEFYGVATEALAEIKIKLSGKFFEDHLGIFRAGHFRAKDAFTSEDATHRKRTTNLLLDYVYADPAEAGKLLAGPAAEWLAFPRMREILARFATERGEQGHQRILALLQAGVPLAQIAPKIETAEALLDQKNQSLAFHALDYLRRESLLSKASEKSWVGIARLLNNEKAESEDWGRLAAEVLATSRDVPSIADVLKQISNSARYEENEEILALVAVAYFRHVVPSKNYEIKKKAYVNAARALREGKRPEVISAKDWADLAKGIDEKLATPEKKKSEEADGEGEVACAKKLGVKQAKQK